MDADIKPVVQPSGEQATDTETWKRKSAMEAVWTHAETHAETDGRTQGRTKGRKNRKQKDGETEAQN